MQKTVKFGLNLGKKDEKKHKICQKIDEKPSKSRVFGRKVAKKGNNFSKKTPKTPFFRRKIVISASETGNSTPPFF